MSGLQKELIWHGNKKDYPSKGDNVTIVYTGWIYDVDKPTHRGRKFDSSIGRADFVTKIGVGRVIAGWEQEVPRMSLGEKCVLVIPGSMAYGQRGFPGLIAPNTALIFEIELRGINSKKS